MIKKEQLTPEALDELNKLSKGNNAFDLLVKNFYTNGEGELAFKDVVARLQAQYFDLSSNEDSLKTTSGWNQNEYNEPNEVNHVIPAIVSGKYSSFALKDIHEDFEINYPLDTDYAVSGMPFADTDIATTQLNLAYRLLSQKLGVEVAESGVATTSTYKTPNKIFAGAVLKVKNLFLKLAKKPQLESNIFKGKITLQSKVGGYGVSNVEKLVKAYDLVLKKSIERDAKQIKQQTKKKVSPEIKYAARLFADILMTRVNDMGNIKNNQIAEKSLWLQFSNVLNRYGFHSQELSQITELGSMAVANTCVNLGITKEKVVERMTRLGFTYTAVPQDISQALLKAKEKDYEKYNDVQETQDTPTVGITPNFVVSEDVNTNGIQREFPIIMPGRTNATNQNNNTTALTEVTTDLVDTTQEQLQNIKASTVEKNVDKLIVKFLADVTTTLADKIESGKLKGKKLAKAEAQLRLYNLTLAYYVQATHKKAMSVKGDYTESEISKAKQLVVGLLNQKKQVANMISTSDITRQENQTSTSYMNAVCKQNLNYTLREYFLKLIKGCVDYCIDQQFGKNGAKPNNEDINDEILSLVGNIESEEENDDVAVDETETQTEVNSNSDLIKKPPVEQLEMDLGFPTCEQLELDIEKLTPKETEYVPNFVFVNEPTSDNGIEK